MLAALRTMIVRLVVLAGIPTMMITVSGPPWPQHPPSAEQVQAYLNTPLNPDHAATTGWALAWALWGITAIGTLAWSITRARSRDWQNSWERLCYYLPGPMQSLAAGLLGTAAVTTTATALPAHATPPAPTADVHPLRDAPMSTESHTITPNDPRAMVGARIPATTAHPRTVKVHRHDTLWGIAKHKLGDPYRWHDIYKLNRGHQQANGHALQDPDEIHVGWVLALPTARHTPPSKSTPAPPTEPTIRPSHTATGTPSRTTAPPQATLAPSITTSTSPATRSPAPTSHPDSRVSAPVAPQQDDDTDYRGEQGVALPPQGWVSLGLAVLLTAVASLVRLQRRRRARPAFPVPARLASQPAPLPESLALVETAACRLGSGAGPDHLPATSTVDAPIGVNAAGREVGLFELPGLGLALHGDEADAAARAVLTAVLATGITQRTEARPIVITTTGVLARLLPDGPPVLGLDPDGTSYDGERLIVLADAATAVTHAEEEMILRRRLLDNFDLDTIEALNGRTDHAEIQPPYVLLIEATPRHAARLRAVGAHRAALHLHPVVLGELDGIPTAETAGVVRLSTLAASDLAAVMTMLTDATARPEPGHDIDIDPPPSDPAAAPHEVSAEQDEPVPSQQAEASAPVRLRVLGPVLVETETGAVATGMRSGSYTVLASLAAHPGGRTLDQLAADLHPDTTPSTAGKRIRTDISTTRRVLRAATGNGQAMFVVYDPATGRYRLDPELIAVDLWQMLTAIKAANTADNDTQALALLREAAELYGGDFADGADQTWITDYATTYRHQILSVLARIAELLEADHPDQAVTALERALEFDPVNEELYQRIMRIHGRAGRPDAVRRTLRRLEDRLADLGGAEPSEATRRVAERQLRPATATRGHR
ncbi:bacterial transcriptional activator domain-containing protein [Actinoplanes teichomyceticus]|nr:bacterial transcriptional activator domain-containing protein [Actinoplanes teichomyceticus]GIF16859.1 hypothetical protein Ate01nite_68910 [Actinoplanes teichomyceticus]